MTTANNPDNNLSPWKPGQSGNPSGRPKGTRGLAGYVLESTRGGKELVDRGFGRSPQQLDIAHSITDRPLEHLSDETLRLLVENSEQLKGR